MTEANIKHLANVFAKGYAAGIEASMPRWIPVTERLPPIGQYALVLVGGVWFKGQLCPEGWTVYNVHGYQGGKLIRPVTHWMQEKTFLPSPPNTQL